MAELIIKKHGGDKVEIGEFDCVDGLVLIYSTNGSNATIQWIDQPTAIQIINHLKEQFGI